MTEMYDCDAVMRQLWDYLDGELTLDREAAVRAHLAVCKRCYPQLRFRARVSRGALEPSPRALAAPIQSRGAVQV